MSLRQLDSERKILSKAFESFSEMLLYANGKKKKKNHFDVKDSSNHLLKTLSIIVQMKPKINKTCSFRTLHQM